MFLLMEMFSVVYFSFHESYRNNHLHIKETQLRLTFKNLFALHKPATFSIKLFPDMEI